jgi:flagellar biosynthetic protein FlhB
MLEQVDEKLIDPTPRRRQQARALGRVAHSGDLSSAGMFLGGLAVLVVTGGALVDHLAGLLTSSLGGQAWLHLVRSGRPADPALLVGQWNPLVRGLAGVLLPPLVLVASLAIALCVGQKGFLFLPARLVPDAARINPLSGLRRLFSAASGVRLTLGVGKLAIIAAVAFASVYQRRVELVSIGAFDLPQVAAFLWDLCLSTGLKVGSALVVLAVVDYVYERWKHERDLRMTPQELREELRNLQGDPQVAARRRAAQRKLAVDAVSRQGGAGRRAGESRGGRL